MLSQGRKEYMSGLIDVFYQSTWLTEMQQSKLYAHKGVA